MKLSQISGEDLSGLTTEQITTIVYGQWSDDGSSADVALLLGGNPSVCPERAEAAAKLWHDGRVKYIMPTGGVSWDSEFGPLQESELLRRYLAAAGVPEEVILPECEATTTIENMICGTLQMQRRIGIRNLGSVMIVTSALHLNRSLRLAHIFLPRTLKISGFCIPRKESGPDHWPLDPLQVKRVMSELRLLKRLVDADMTADIEY